MQKRIDEIQEKQKGLDRKSLVTGIEKYDDAFKRPLSKRASANSLHQSLTNMLTSTPINSILNRGSKRNLGTDNLEVGGIGASGGMTG